MEDYLEYGPVLVTKGEHKGQIGFYDDDLGVSFDKLMIFPRTPTFCDRYYVVKRTSATSVIPTDSIARRWGKIDQIIYSEVFRHTLTPEEMIDLLHERIFCSDLLNDRYYRAMEAIDNQSKCNVFISHASEDLGFARGIASDLLDAGYSVFLDDWSIDVGDRIFDKINESLNESSALIMIVSKNYNKSVCCKDEWSAFYNKACHLKSCRIYPIIIDDSKIPMILSQIKYLRINIDEDLTTELHPLLKALKKQFDIEK
ncbi:MAG: toll/interleukin-1 receptor domain-containing protein [Clostridia bacterium]|nr:toll/interleukin-1 receptor domain-containing protein [Clostridia bacterium]